MRKDIVFILALLFVVYYFVMPREKFIPELGVINNRIEPKSNTRLVSGFINIPVEYEPETFEVVNTAGRLVYLIDNDKIQQFRNKFLQFIDETEQSGKFPKADKIRKKLINEKSVGKKLINRIEKITERKINKQNFYFYYKLMSFITVY